jgi:hypothetical protein
MMAPGGSASPGWPGVTPAADGPEQIATQARDALASAVDAGLGLPPAIEDRAIPPSDLADYNNPLIVLVSYAPSPSPKPAPSAFSGLSSEERMRAWAVGQPSFVVIEIRFSKRLIFSCATNSSRPSFPFDGGARY